MVQLKGNTNLTKMSLSITELKWKILKKEDVEGKGNRN